MKNNNNRNNKKKNKENKKYQIALFSIEGAVIIVLLILFISYKSKNGNESNNDKALSISENEADTLLNADGVSQEQTNEKTNEIIDIDNVNSDSYENKTKGNEGALEAKESEQIEDNELDNSSKLVEENKEDEISSNTEESTNTIEESFADATMLLSKESGTIVDSSEIDESCLDSYFSINEIPDDVITYITGKTYEDNPNISIDDLRYIKLIHYNFDGNIQVGEIIVNKKVAEEVKDIFMNLYKEKYEIFSMYLPDRFWDGDPNSTDTASCDANNTSGFFYRTVEGSTKLSNHSYGTAVDINPRQNPYVSYKSGTPKCEHENAMEFIDRTTGKAHMITENDLCYKLFTQRGYTWGGGWKNIKDYQHFEK